MQRSTVKWFDAKKGYGFIDHPEGGDDVFVHYSQIISEKDFKTLRTGQEVTFDMNDGPKGLHALEVTPLEEQSEADAPEAAAPQEEESAQEESGVSAAAEPASADEPSEPAQTEPAEEHVAQQEDEWQDEDWEEEEWTDEHGNPPDPMAGPSF